MPKFKQMIISNKIFALAMRTHCYGLHVDNNLGVQRREKIMNLWEKTIYFNLKSALDYSHLTSLTYLCGFGALAVWCNQEIETTQQDRQQ